MTVQIANNQIEILEIQSYKNLKIVPLSVENSFKEDILTLKKGFEMGLVTIKECGKSTVSQVTVVNNAVTPLLLVDGEEILGAKQNRIISGTVLIPAKTTQNIDVCCSEKGRWAFKEEKNIFSCADNIAPASIRGNMNYAKYEDTKNHQGFKSDIQQGVWKDISKLEKEMDFKSETSALSENYANNQEKLENYLEHFKRLDNQSGLIAILNDEIIGCEILVKPYIYKDYHENFLRSYIIEALTKKEEPSSILFTEEYIREFLESLTSSDTAETQDSVSLGKTLILKNSNYNGRSRVYKDFNIHTSFFKNPASAKI